MPTSIELSLKIGGKLSMKEVVWIPIEIPGKRVQALTSSYAIAREVKFSRRGFKEE